MCKRILKFQTTTSGDVPFFKIGTFGKNPDAFISQDIYNRYKKKYHFPKKGEILISAAGTIGRTVIYNGDPAYFQDSNIIWVSNNEKTVKNKFLYYVYQIKKWETANGTIARLYNDIIREIIIIIPLLPEQNRIVKVLETWDKAIEKLERKIEIKKNVKKGLMQRLLTGKLRLAGFTGEWKEVRLGEVCRVKRGDMITEKCLEIGNIPVIAGGKQPAYYNNKSNYRGKTITVSGSGASAGFVNFFDEQIFASDCSVVKANDDTNIEFIFYFLKDKQQYIYSLQSGGAQPHVYPRDLSRIILDIPKKKEQDAISDIINSFNRGVKLLENKLKILKAQKKFLLNNLVTGRIRVPESVKA